jgi:DNA-binding transcriptional ArsR family regulator
MSIQLVSDVLRCGPVFRVGEKAVALVLANYADEDGISRPSVPELSWTSGLSERQARRILPDLEDLGIVDIIEKGGGRRANRYRINTKWLHEAAAAIQRTKQKALQDGARDRYAVMADVAAAIRGELEAAMHADPVRGPRWRERHPARRSPAAGPADGGFSAPTAGRRPGRKRAERAAQKNLGVTPCHPSPDIGDASPDMVSPQPCQSLSPEPSLEQKPDPSIERVQAASELREPQRRGKRKGPGLGEGERSGEAEPSPQACERAETLKAAINRAAGRTWRRSASAGDRERALSAALEAKPLPAITRRLGAPLASPAELAAIADAKARGASPPGWVRADVRGGR